jgi:translation initiation factor IF-2
MSEPQSVQTVTVPRIITVGEFADRIELPVTKVITELMKNGVMATINEDIDFETAAIIGEDLGFQVELEQTEEEAAPVSQKVTEGTHERPPVVAIMGHVDHGKTTLLDTIRQTKVAEGESGGITQHITSYQVEKNGKKITFLDTPGHEAFQAMRAHGGHLSDVAVIVVAADDGVKPQTREAIEQARSSGTQIVVAINKIDKADANVDRVKQELTDMDLAPEDWGGKTVTVPISAKTGEGIDKLLEMILLVSEVLELKADPEAMAEGVVIESHMDQGKGPVATVLVENGTLNIGDFVVVGHVYGRVRAMQDFRGKRYQYAGPSTPVAVSGLKEVPQFGERLREVASEKDARSEAQGVLRGQSVKRYSEVKKIGVDELTAAVHAGKVKQLNILLKADVQGSIEAIKFSLDKLKNDEVAVNIVAESVGDVTEGDVTRASASSAVILGFNVAMPAPISQLAKQNKVTVSLYTVIYELIDDVKKSLESQLAPERVRTDRAEVEILGVFATRKGSVVAGGKVTSGKLERDLEVEISRGSEIVAKGRISSLRREKDEVREVTEGVECGFAIELESGSVEVGDKMKAFSVEERARTLG